MMRIGLFLLTNLAVLIVFSIVFMVLLTSLWSGQCPWFRRAKLCQLGGDVFVIRYDWLSHFVVFVQVDG